MYIGWDITKPEGGISALWTVLLIISGVGTIGLIYVALREFGKGNALRVLGLSSALILMLFTVRAGYIASFVTKDNPKDMLIYTQTSASIPQIKAHIDELAASTGKGKNLRITVDGSDGFSWPWVWYLREYKAVGYPCLASDTGCQPLQTPADSDVMLMNQRTVSSNSQQLLNYGVTQTAALRHWFPEDVYRGWTPKSIVEDLSHAGNWKKVWNFFAFRETALTIGQVDTVVYYPKDYTPPNP